MVTLIARGIPFSSAAAFLNDAVLELELKLAAQLKEQLASEVKSVLSRRQRETLSRMAGEPYDFSKPRSRPLVRSTGRANRVAGESRMNWAKSPRQRSRAEAVLPAELSKNRWK
jgi:hypothetical protein